MDGIAFKLAAFEGPLDLLLRLIEKNKIDIYDIPIAMLAEQYLAAIHTQQAGGENEDTPANTSIAISADSLRLMENMSEFLVMAATLLEIKSRMLLPKPAAEEEAPEDPREALVRQLLAYRQCQQLAEQLKSADTRGERFTRAADTELFRQFSVVKPSQVLLPMEPETLWSIFSEVLKRKILRTDTVRAGYGNVPRETFTVEEKIIVLTERLAVHGPFSLIEIFEECETRAEMVATFLALLEMTRRKQVELKQSRMFGDINVAAAA
jgi:segregation and condensation protein A